MIVELLELEKFPVRQKLKKYIVFIRIIIVSKNILQKFVAW